MCLIFERRKFITLVSDAEGSTRYPLLAATCEVKSQRSSPSRIRTLGPGITVDTVFLGLLGILPSAAGIRALGRLSIDFGSTPARRKTPVVTAPFRPYPASVARWHPFPPE